MNAARLLNSRTVAAVALLALWLATHPYAGLVHDARLYTLLALDHLSPGRYEQDPFLLATEQSRFTFFPILYAQAIEWLGLSLGAIALLLAGQAVWITGAITLLRGMAYPPAIWVAGLLIVLLPGTYGGLTVLAFGESFLTPRLFAEGLSLAAIGLSLTRRPAGALACLVAASLFHPLMALAPAGLVVILMIQSSRNLLLLTFAGASIILAASAINAPPFDKLLQTIDPEWFAVVNQRNPYLLPSLWQGPDWARAVTAAAVVLTAALLNPSLRRFWTAALLLPLAGLALTAIIGEYFRNLMVLQLQPWRALWLMQFAAYAGLGLLLARWQTHSREIRAGLLLLFSGILLPLYPVASIACSLLGLTVTLSHLSLQHRIAQNTLTAVNIIPVAAIFAWLSDHLWYLLTPYFLSGQNLAPQLLRAVAQACLVALPTLAVLRHAISQNTQPTRLRPSSAAVALVAALALVLAGANWDHRSDWASYLETHNYDWHASVEPGLPELPVVYWQDDVQAAWFYLRRANYISTLQGAGIIFSRKAALLYRDRVLQVQELGAHDELNPFVLAPRGEDESSPRLIARVTPDKLIAFCNNSANMRLLIILPTVLQSLSPLHFTVQNKTYYAYDCEYLRHATY